MNLLRMLAVFLLWPGTVFAECDDPVHDANKTAKAALNNQQSDTKADQTRQRRPGDKPRPKEDWPDVLAEVVEELRARNAEPDYVDLRYADSESDSPYFDGGFYWRMPANRTAIDAHIKAFGLKKAIAGTDLTSKIYDRYPKSWPRPKGKNVTWYAWPYNRDDEPIRAHFWQIMAHDEQEKVLYFFYWIWDVGI